MSTWIGRAWVAVLHLALVGCGLETRVETEVPAVGQEHCGSLRFACGEEPPYPPAGEVDEDRLRAAVRKAAVDNGVAANQIEAEVDRIMTVLREPTTYGVLAVAGFTSHRRRDEGWRVPCPRFVQLVRSRLKVRGSATHDLGFVVLGRNSPWAQSGGKPSAEGWGVDRVQKGTDPCYGDDDSLGVFQYWSGGTVRLVDVPGVATPWVTNRPGDVLTVTFEFQTWLLAPCAEAGLVDEEIEGGHGAGGGGGASGPMPCETFPNQPPRPRRMPVGRVEWGFTTTVVVGADASSTRAEISGSYYRWVEGRPAANSTYVSLMTANYADWVPP